MKKQIICHYKNGALLFRTTENFPRKEAQNILKFFRDQGLKSVLEPKLNNTFQVLGRIYLNYDPFVLGSVKWEDVLAKMTTIMENLEDKIKPLSHDLSNNVKKYVSH